MDEAMKEDANSLSPSNFIPRVQDLDRNSNEDSMASGSLSPLTSDEKVQSRYLGPHVASCHDYCKYGKKHETAAQRLNFRRFVKKKSAQEAEKNQATKPKAASKVESGFLGAIEVSDPQTLLPMKKSVATGKEKTPEASEEIEESRINSSNENKTQTSVKTPISPVARTVIRRKGPKSVSEPQEIKRKAPRPLKRVDVATKPAMTLKARAPLLRSLSKRKSSRSLIHRINQDGEIMVSPGSEKSGERVQGDKTIGSPIKSRIGEATPLSPPPASFPPKTPHDHSSNLQLRKLRSIKRTSTSRDNVSGLQLRKVSSIKRTSTLHGNISGLQLRRLGSSKRTSAQNMSAPSLRLKKLRSIKRTSAPRDNDSSLQLRKLKSIKRTSTPNHESAPCLQLKKLGSIKRTSMSHGSASSLQLRKLQSIKRTSKSRESDPRLQLKKLGSSKRTATSRESVPSLQLKKLRSIKRTSTPHESVPSLQMKKLRSIKRISTPHESVSSSQPTKLSNAKQTTTPQDRILSYLPRKLRSMKRSLSVKDKHNVEKPNVESNSRNIDFDQNAKIEESKRAIPVFGDNDTKRMQNTASIRAEDNTSAPVKLKFRRGKIINLRSDSKGARNLWLNIGKLASENPIGNGLLRRRSSRRRRDNASFDSKSFDPDGQSIVLKHQDVIEKKDAKSLFNDVIEETASKLVKTRKSKVKALVGAFETVISLLDSRPVSVVRV